MVSTRTLCARGIINSSRSIASFFVWLSLSRCVCVFLLFAVSVFVSVSFSGYLLDCPSLSAVYVSFSVPVSVYLCLAVSVVVSFSLSCLAICRGLSLVHIYYFIDSPQSSQLTYTAFLFSFFFPPFPSFSLLSRQLPASLPTTTLSMCNTTAAKLKSFLEFALWRRLTRAMSCATFGQLQDTEPMEMLSEATGWLNLTSLCPFLSVFLLFLFWVFNSLHVLLFSLYRYPLIRLS